MATTKYVPFLKAKVNEFGALKALAENHKEVLVPFIDIPMKTGLEEPTLRSGIETVYSKVLGNLKGYSGCFIDNFDIPDAITINGVDAYQYVIDQFAGYNFHPVVGLDRSPQRNALVFKAKAGGDIVSSRIAIRLQPDDFSHYSLVRQDILNLLAMGAGLFHEWVLVLDNRICSKCNADQRGAEIASFIQSALQDFNYSSIVVAGSSVPSSIADVISVKRELILERRELDIYSVVRGSVNYENLVFGDYTIVSPNYSDLVIIPEILRNIMAPKILYSYDGVHYIARGGALKTDPRSDYQYNDMAQILIGKPFYRGPAFSSGDKYIYEKAASIGKLVTASSVLNPTINAHMTYMLSIF